MSKIIDIVSELPELLVTGAASKDDIECAEKELGVRFPIEYREYLMKFGSILADDIEITGIAKSKNRNVVVVTEREWELNPNVEHNMYVIENIGIEGIIIWQDEEGKIYKTSPNKKAEKIADSLVEYIKTK